MGAQGKAITKDKSGYSVESEEDDKFKSYYNRGKNEDKLKIINEDFIDKMIEKRNKTFDSTTNKN